MTHHATRPSRRAALPAVLALTLAAFAGGSAVTDPALADAKKGSEGIISTTVLNNNIQVGKATLFGKCMRSGGDFYSNGNGTYGCSVGEDDNGASVHCNKNGKCTGDSREPGPRPQ